MEPEIELINNREWSVNIYHQSKSQKRVEYIEKTEEEQALRDEL